MVIVGNFSSSGVPSCKLQPDNFSITTINLFSIHDASIYSFSVEIHFRMCYLPQIFYRVCMQLQLGHYHKNILMGCVTFFARKLVLQPVRKQKRLFLTLFRSLAFNKILSACMQRSCLYWWLVTLSSVQKFYDGHRWLSNSTCVSCQKLSLIWKIDKNL